MQLVRKKIRFIPTVDQNIEFVLSENVNLSGFQDDIDDFVAEETGLSINDVKDKETFRYKPDSTNTMKIKFFSGSSYYSTYEAAGFTTEEIDTRDEVILRSFYIMQVYDSVSIENQTLLHTGYYNGFNFIRENDSSTTYYFSPDNEEEFMNLYIPQWFIESLSGQSTTLWGKTSFYNAKTGELQLFSHETQGIGDYEQPTIDQDFYYDITLNPTGFTHDIGNIMYGFEVQNTDYVDKVNNSIDSFDNLKPTYPTGDTFLNTGQYVESEDI